MKKLFILILAVWFSVFASYSQSQSLTTTGIKTAVNLSGYSFRNIEHVGCCMKTGMSFGGLINFKMTEHFSLQTELSLSYKVSEFNNQETNRLSNYEHFSIEIPVYAILKKNLKRGAIFAGAGLYMGAGFKAGVQDFNLYEEEVKKPVDFGTAAVIGYELRNRLHFFAGSQVGLVNLIDVGDSNAKMKLRSFSVGIGYKFRPPKEEKIRFNF